MTDTQPPRKITEHENSPLQEDLRPEFEGFLLQELGLEVMAIENGVIAFKPFPSIEDPTLMELILVYDGNKVDGRKVAGSFGDLNILQLESLDEGLRGRLTVVGPAEIMGLLMTGLGSSKYRKQPDEIKSRYGGIGVIIFAKQEERSIRDRFISGGVGIVSRMINAETFKYVTVTPENTMSQLQEWLNPKQEA